ncbi:hypothetical protein [Anaerosalibacter sp. Marseille-P3206]|uniref:hypothetical protein n=1 Tax=Anaerosalibacter sp. Marseille-P3206 TaxID=1871005 RepID=UPI0009864D50|nr:hypothetical protein [Anaerosalibacter sp. Marseille-P3206]
MSTRLFVQTLIQNLYPNLNVRVWQPPNKYSEINIYLGDSEEFLNKDTISSIKKLLPCHLEYNFKIYHQLNQDKVPPEPKLPPLVERLAMSDGGNKEAIKLKIEKGLPDLVPFVLHVAVPENIIGIETKNKFTDEELVKLQIYAQELAPLGTWIKVFCKK